MEDREGTLFVVALSLRFGMHWLISSQVAFISSLLATLASFWSYKRLIEKKIATGDIPPEDRDELDTIDDRFELYDGEETAPAPGAEELKQVIKEERRKIGGLKKGMQNLAVTISAAVSPLRVAAYVILVLGFLYLNRHDLLEIWGYVLGLTVVPLVALFEGRRAG